MIKEYKRTTILLYLVFIFYNVNVSKMKVYYPKLEDYSLCKSMLGYTNYIQQENLCNLPCFAINSTTIPTNTREVNCASIFELTIYNNQAMFNNDGYLIFYNFSGSNRISSIMNHYTEIEAEVLEFREIDNKSINYYYLHFIPSIFYKINSSKYSIMIYLFDAASRYIFRKQMSNTINVLKSIRKNYNVYEMLRYHSVGPRSIHNYLPLFYGTNDTTKRHKIIFEDFEENNYTSITLLGDCHNHSELYGNTSYKGAHHNIILGCKFSNLFLYGSKPRCVGNKHYHQLYLDYLNTAVDYYHRNSIPFISYVSFMEAHEETHTSLIRVDKDFSDHLNRLVKAGALDNSILILLSDHGMNYGSHYNTKFGKIDRSLPFLNIIVPKRFCLANKRECESLKINQNRFVTNYEVYNTLKSLAYNSINIHDKSLFKEIPIFNNCSSYGIEPYMCQCL